MFRSVYIGSIVVVMLVSISLQAHEIKIFASRYTLPETGTKTTIYLSWGHRVPVDELVDATPIERYELLPSSGAPLALKKEGSSLQANVTELKEVGVYQALVVRKPSVYTYVLNDEGERQPKRGPKTEHAGAKIESASRYFQTGKALFVVGKPSDSVPKTLGLPIEIVPLDAPSKWTTNADVRFQILLDGKPVPAAEVQARDVGFKPNEAWCYATESNRKGEFTIRAERPGTWIIKVNVKKLAQGKARDEYDFEASTTTLTLEIR